MVVQILVLTGIAVVLLRPWWLVTRRRCGLCRSATPRRHDHCKFCGAPAGVVASLAAAVSARGRSIDEIGQALGSGEDVATPEPLRDLRAVDTTSIESWRDLRRSSS
jgi:hypothetical protein